MFRDRNLSGNMAVFQGGQKVDTETYYADAGVSGNFIWWWEEL